MLPRPFPPGSAIGIDADWLAWDYFTFQATDEFESGNRASLLDCSPDPVDWDCVSWARNQDAPREQIEAEEAASGGSSDTIQSQIKAQAEAEGVGNSAIPGSSPSDALFIPHSPPGCHGADPVGCLSLRSQMRAERWAASTAWSLTRLAAVLEHCASRLRETVAAPASNTEPQQPAAADSTRASGWLEPSDYTAASQQFLSELYLGL
jgi:hypothetical protein